MTSSEDTALLVGPPPPEVSPPPLRRRPLSVAAFWALGGATVVGTLLVLKVAASRGFAAAAPDGLLPPTASSFLQLDNETARPRSLGWDCTEQEPDALASAQQPDAQQPDAQQPLPEALRNDPQCKWERADRGRVYCAGRKCLNSRFVAANVCQQDSEAESFARCGFRRTCDGENGMFGGDASPVYHCSDGYVRSMLVGPFRTHAQQWTSVRVPFALLERGDRIVSSSGDAVDAADARTPLGYPPLHMHHIHVQREEPHFFETHGDYDMHAEQGYGSTLPHGSCVRHDGQRISVSAHPRAARGAGAGMAGAGGGVEPTRTRRVVRQLPADRWPREAAAARRRRAADVPCATRCAGLRPA